MKKEMIKKLSDNLYLWFYDTNGHVRYGYADTEEKAKADLAENKKHYDLILDDWFPVFLAREELRGSFKDSTSDKYQQLYKSFISPSIGEKSLPQITPGNIEEVINRMIEEDNSPISVDGVKILMNRILESAVVGGLISVNPMKMADLPKSKKKPKERQPFTDKELEELIHRLEKKSKWSKGSMVLIVKVAGWTGMRLGEVLGLQWEDIDWRKGILQVRHNLTYSSRRGYELTALKTEKSRRCIPLSEEHLNELKEWRNNENRKKMAEKVQPEFKELLFLSRSGNPVNLSAVSRAVRVEVNDMKKEGILDSEKEYTFHSLRHTFATNGVLKDMQPKVLSTLMGHSSIRITMDIYAHVGEEMLRHEMERCGMM